MKNRKLIKSVMKTVVCSSMAFTMFAVTACNSEGTHPEGDGPETGATQLSAPVITLADDVISWSAVPNADAYDVYEGTTVVSSQQTTLSYIIDKNDGEAYTYTVKATSSDSNYKTSAASNAVTYQSIVSYSVTFMMDDIVFDKQTVVKGSTAKQIATDPAKPGYEFDRWVTTAGGSTEYSFDTQINADTTVYASWTEKVYDSFKVTFETNGGSVVTEQDVTAGGKAVVPATPTKDSCKFAGWYTDEAFTAEFDFNTAINNVTVLYAKWELADGLNGITEDTKYLFGTSTTSDESTSVYALNETVTYQGNEGTFDKLTLDGTSGKISTEGRTTDVQFNDGAVVYFYVDKACTVKVAGYTNEYTVNGVAAAAQESDWTIQSFEINGAGKVSIAATGTNYLKSIEIVYPVVLDPITSDSSVVFGSGTNSNYTSSDFKDLIVVDGTSRDQDTETQFGLGTTISFAVNAGAKVEVLGYSNASYCYYTVGIKGGTTSDEQHANYTLNVTKAGVVVITSTNANNYLCGITITYPEEEVSDVPNGYEKVETTCDFATLADIYGDGTKISSKVTYGKFEFETGLYFEKSKNDVNTQGKTFYFTVTAKDNMNTASFTMDPSASGNFKSMTITGPNSNTVFTWSRDVDGATSKTVTLTDLPAGKYTVSTDASCRISNLKISEVLEQGNPASMTLKPVTVDFLKNGTFSSVGLKADVTYENSAVKSQDNPTIDSSSVDMTKEGEYIVRAFYTELGETVCATYTVYVHSVVSLEYSTYTTSGAKQTTLARVYKVGGTFSLDGLTVNAVAKCGTKTTAFKLSANDYTYEAPDLSTAGEKTVTLTAKANTAININFTINVVNLAEVVDNTVTVTVDPSKAISSTNFKTINEALTYLANYDSGVKKVINIADGEYYEKVNINLPNVTLLGSATKTPNATTNNGVVIWYDAIAGLKDASGATYGTNGSASVTVTSSATNFVAKNVTFKNYYNTNALYNQSLKISTDSQAVALLIESASASFYNCKLTGYHDTLYANKGNHYFNNCWIEGHTDFIFGQDARTYYHNCTIYSIGSGASEKNGGYIVALKPTSSTYYSVFNGCEFTSDGNVMDGTIALGRAWGPEMKMVVINCDISGKYSTTAHNAGTTSGQRYCTMSGNEPKAENMLEYNNTGAGAISSSIANTCTYMTETAAAAYQSDKISTILGFSVES